MTVQPHVPSVWRCREKQFKRHVERFPPNLLPLRPSGTSSTEWNDARRSVFPLSKSDETVLGGQYGLSRVRASGSRDPTADGLPQMSSSGACVGHTARVTPRRSDFVRLHHLRPMTDRDRSGPSCHFDRTATDERKWSVNDRNVF